MLKKTPINPMKKTFDRIIIVMFENQYRSYVQQDAFMRKLATAGADMSNYFGVFHPSQTNYVASLAGEVCSVTNDTPPIAPLMQETLVDLLESAGISWKAYMEGYPGEPWNPQWKDPNYAHSNPDIQPLTEFPNDGNNLARYYRKHNAFASFHNIQKEEARWNKIVDDARFWKDISTGSLPQYSWFTPDIWNDGHYLYNTHVDTNPRTKLIPQISGWLEYVFFSNIETKNLQGGKKTGLKNIGLNLDIDLLLQNPEKAWAQSNVPQGTLIVVTFDEADFDAVGYDTSYEGPNQVYTILLGDGIAPGTVIDVPYNHYSLIKTIEKNYNLGSLAKNDKGANWFRFLWKEKFAWSEAKDMQLKEAEALALTAFDEDFILVFQKENGSLWQSHFQDNTWSRPLSTGLTSKGELALSTIDNALHLVFTDDEGALYTAKSDGSAPWSEPVALGYHTTGAIAMSTYFDEADQCRKMMLCWQGPNGFIQFLIYNNGKWQNTAGNVGQLTDGPMALAQLGPSLFLVYKERNTRAMRLTSFNLAPYNSFKALNFEGQPDPENNTSIHQWSPADMPVGNFSKKLNALQNSYLSLGKLAMASIEGEMHLLHRGAYEDTPSAFSEYFGLTGIFTAENQLTNGYGTIDQAGWTLEQELPAIQLAPDSPIVMGGDGQKLLVVWRENGTAELKFVVGAYGKN